MTYNRHEIIGRLGADPEVRRPSSGDLIVTMRVVTSDFWRDKQTGERKEKAEWHTVVIFNQALAKTAEQYLSKGNIVFIAGKSRTRKWEDQQGNTRYSTELVLENFSGELKLMPQGNSGGRGPASQDDYGDERSRDSAGHTANQQGGGYNPALDDEIPFAPEWRG
ncbi:single-stranded DNA-binding protein [Brucella anthropi]|uniref:single-stranded DNA-binding protein n=1 Tax=Brucella anthropi TaxID=529 RepID=UPI00124E8E89|nr:single-stranded DNA-binding protein [Brucella anthropi]KAB2724165.1 single-stranded DNA-binding protein [Brucella anthropi]KAB2739697.1 single-stranded DNA-binding protein [Brucella anthropi]KAB2802056.1 single-stranded DNA-binding protein [Brucella anthropi]